MTLFVNIQSTKIINILDYYIHTRLLFKYLALLQYI